MTSNVIDVVEAAYDLDKFDAGWLPNLIEVGRPVFDHGLGVFGFEFFRPHGASGAEASVRGMQMKSMPAEFEERFASARAVLSPEFVRAVTPPGYAGTWSEIAADHPEEFRELVRALGFTDFIGILAVDPNGVGVDISAPLPDTLRLTPKARERWQMLGAHIAAAYRLRRALSTGLAEAIREPTGLPHDAEAIFDGSGYRVVEACGPARAPSSAEVLRRAARRVEGHAERCVGKIRSARSPRGMHWSAAGGRWSTGSIPTSDASCSRSRTHLESPILGD